MSFKLETLLADDHDEPIAESWDYQPTYVATPPTLLSVAATGGHRATVTISPEGQFTGSVSATVNSVTGSATITVADTTLWTGAQIVATHTDGQAASLVLFDGGSATATGSGCAHDQIVAFVAVGLLGNQGGGCGRVAVFSPDHAFVAKSVSWSGSRDVVDVRAAQGNTPLAIPVKFWVAIDDPTETPSLLAAWRDSARDQAVLDVRRARALFRNGRTGLSVVIPGGAATVLTSSVDISEIGTDCPNADELWGNSSGPMAKDTLNVYYVIGLVGSRRGLTCWETPTRSQYVVYIDWRKESQTTLAHELGHVLGLRNPDNGHTTFVPGFNYTNMMAEVNDEVANDRNSLSLGQAFRMNLDVTSWVNLSLGGVVLRQSPTTSVACQCRTDQASPCPELALDVLMTPDAGKPVASVACASVARARVSQEQDMAMLGDRRRRGGR